VRGAQPGDTLAVEILEIRLGEQGYSRFRAGGGVITAELRPPFAKIIPVVVTSLTSCASRRGRWSA
jgi:acetamidase/formamidase